MAMAGHGPDAFRKILAMTFTNKATSEMKERIIKELKRLKHTVQSDQKMVYEAFNDNSPRDIPSISISKLVTMNDPRHKQFLSIYDQGEVKLHVTIAKV